jgi:hypothetical protein
MRVELRMFQGLNNLAVVAVLCIGIVVLSYLVIEGLYYLTAAYPLPAH